MMIARLLFLFGLASAGVPTLAETAGPLWTCTLQADNLKGKTTSLVLTKTVIEGTGKVKCTSFETEVESPVDIKMSAFGAGLVIGSSEVSDLAMAGVSAGLADPELFFGTYRGAKLAASFIIPEAALSLSFRGNENGAGIGVDLIGSLINEGFQLGVSLQGWKLELTPL